jgi:competence protein ComEC
MISKIFYLLFILLIIFRVASVSYDYPEGKIIRLSGRVLTDPIVYDTARYIKVKGLTDYIDLFPEVSYGDRVILEGEVEGDRLRKAKVVELRQGGGLYDTREKIVSLFRKAFPEPHASLVGGIVLGSKTGMPEDFWESLKASGTAHVVVASGMNVTFVASFLVNSLVHFIKRQKAIIVALLGAWVYVLLSGFDAPLVRAAIMGSIAFGAQGMGRVNIALRALIFSAGLMLVLKPEWVYDLGFILSFFATLSLVLFETRISGLLERFPFLFKKDLATTLAAQIGVSPILLLAFGGFNIFSPFINALILWTVPPIMIIGAAAAITGLVIPQLGQAILYLAYPFTYWYIKIVELFS